MQDDGMRKDGKLMEMLTGYAASHRHPVNVFVHLVGIPTIMFGVLVPLTWVGFDAGIATVNLAHCAVVGFFLFYLTLDSVFAAVFLVLGLVVAYLARIVGELPLVVSGTVAAAAFFGGYIAQFIGHAVEKSMPVLLRHPVQANLAAPFFQVVEVFKLLGLRTELFDAVQRNIEAAHGQGREE
jgi:uncharacterized membrane protein YGL010W